MKTAQVLKFKSFHSLYRHLCYTFIQAPFESSFWRFHYTGLRDNGPFLQGCMIVSRDVDMWMSALEHNYY